MMDTIMEQQRQRASIPAFGGWENMAAGDGDGAVPDYSLDFSKIRAARMQRRKALSWSTSTAGAPGGEEQQQGSTTAASGGGGSEDRERRGRRHRRQLSDDTETRQPICAPPKLTGRSRFKGYFFGCVGRW